MFGLLVLDKRYTVGFVLLSAHVDHFLGLGFTLLANCSRLMQALVASIEELASTRL